jgi:hypothetical protein
MRMTFSLGGRFDLRLLSIFAAGIIIRTMYAVLAPLSPDWGGWYIMGMEVYYQPGLIFGVYTVPAYIFAALYGLWSGLPVPHPDLFSIVTPPYWGGVPPYFQPTVSSIIFVFVMKLPALISDVVIAAIICKILTESGTSRNRTHFAVAAWLLNPLTMVMSNYNAVDPIPIMLVVAAAYWASKKKYGPASVSLIIGGLMRQLAFIVLPFLIVKTLRSKDWKGLLSTSVPIVVVFALISSWLALFRPDALALFQGRPGFYVPEALDVFGSALQLRGMEYAEDVITLMTFSYIFVLAFITAPSRTNSRNETLVLAPLLAYTAFAWSIPEFMEYVIPLALVQLARGKGFRTLTIFLSLGGLLWAFVQSAPYVLCFGGAYFFFIPPYNNFLQELSGLCLSAHTLVLSSGMSVQIRAAFSAILILLMLRLLRRNQYYEKQKLSGTPGMSPLQYR